MYTSVRRRRDGKDNGLNVDLQETPEALPWAPAKGPGGSVANGDAASPEPEAAPTVAVTEGRNNAQFDNLVKPNVGFTRHVPSDKMPQPCEDGTSYLVHTLETTTVQPGQHRSVDTGVELYLPEHVGMQLEM